MAVQYIHRVTVTLFSIKIEIVSFQTPLHSMCQQIDEEITDEGNITCIYFQILRYTKHSWSSWLFLPLIIFTLDYFSLCWEPREEPQENISLVGQVALSCTPQDPVFASKIGWWEKWYRHEVISKEIPFSYVFKYTGNNLYYSEACYMKMGKGSAAGKEKHVRVPGDVPAWTSGEQLSGSFAGKPWDLEERVSICQTDTHKSCISLSNTSQDCFCFPSGVSIVGKRLNVCEWSLPVGKVPCLTVLEMPGSTSPAQGLGAGCVCTPCTPTSQQQNSRV